MADKPLTVAAVQRLIDASFIRHAVTHGHLSEADATTALAALEEPERPPRRTTGDDD